MRQVAVYECERLLSQMAKNILALQSPGSHERCVDLWRDVIFSYVRIFNKLRAGAKGEPTSWAFTNRILSEIRTDPILAYAKAARGADEHGFGVHHARTQAISGIFEVDPPTDPIFIREGIRQTTWFESSFLLPITNEGRTYYPPAPLRDRTLENFTADPSTPMNVAFKLGLTVGGWVEEAKVLPKH